MEFITSIFTYFFDRDPGSQFKFYLPLGILILALIIGSIVFREIYKRKKRHDLAFKKTFKGFSFHMVMMAILFVLLLLVRYESIPYFSMRIWLYLSLLLLVFLAGYYLKLYKVDYPKAKSRQESRTQKVSTAGKQYLPNKKKRK